jgi:hypothetical protein
MPFPRKPPNPRDLQLRVRGIRHAAKAEPRANHDERIGEESNGRTENVVVQPPPHPANQGGVSGGNLIVFGTALVLVVVAIARSFSQQTLPQQSPRGASAG